MKSIAIPLLLCFAICTFGHGNPQLKNETRLEGELLEVFLKKYLELEVGQIEKGHTISLRVPNADESDRKFHSVQLFLLSNVESKDPDVDVFEVTSGRNGGDIDFLMNLSDSKLQSSYIVLREERGDNSRKASEWVETTIQLRDILATTLPKAQPGTGPVAEPEGGDKTQPEVEGRSR